MKYIDSEKLIAEIERQRDSALERQKNLKKIGQETVLNEMIAAKLNGLLSFIDSLQQEKPEVDLEKEIKNYLATKCAGDDEPSVSEIARHFYELGSNARKED